MSRIHPDSFLPHNVAKCMRYDITYQLLHQLGEPEAFWHTHWDMDDEDADALCSLLCEIGREFRVRCNQTGDVVLSGPIVSKEPLTVLHLFFKRISDRNGEDTEDE